MLVITDDQQADAISALGHPVVRTPSIDALVERGTTFTQARIMGSLMPAVCAPSRACVLTGQNVFRADANPMLDRGPEFQVNLPADACTLPEHFRKAGYSTFFTGKWHNCLASLERSFTAGSQIFHGGMCSHTAVPVLDYSMNGRRALGEKRIAEGFSSEIFADAAIDFIRGHHEASPFFVFLAFTSPHDPRTPPPDFRCLYDERRMPLPLNFLPRHPFDNGELSIRDELLAELPREPNEIRRHLADYYGMISHHDAQIGRVVEAVRQRGAFDSTLFVFLSDHGLAVGQHGLMGKQNMYDHSVRVPLILAGPGVPTGELRDSPVYALDLYATLSELADLPVPPDLESRSLVPVMESPTAAVRDEIFSLYMDCQRMVTDGRWKLIRYRVDGVERLQLFDLERDPWEMNDLAARPEHAATVAWLLDRMSHWQNNVGDPWMGVAGAAMPF